ncbi:uncharacterized protein LOC144545316 [Carex rostrata]
MSETSPVTPEASSESNSTTALLEKLTQMISLQQTQILALQHTSQPSPITHEGHVHPNPIDVKFDGTNFGLWSQTVELYVKGKERTRHLTGVPPPPLSTEPTYQKWEMDDTIVKGWLINSLETRLRGSFIRNPTARDVWKAVATTFYDGNDAAQVLALNRKVFRTKQIGRSVEEYYNELQGLWQEIDFRRPNPMIYPEEIEKFNKFMQETRVYMFLDGLDDRLDRVRADVVQTVPFPTVEQAYARVRQEATRQGVMLKGGDEVSQPSMAMISKGYKQPEVKLNLNKKISNQDGKQGCTHCGGPKHTKENCFHIIGFPEWWKKKPHDGRKGKGAAHIISSHNSAHSASAQNNGVTPTYLRTTPQLNLEPIQNCANQGAAAAHAVASQVDGSSSGSEGKTSGQGYPNGGDHWAWF